MFIKAKLFTSPTQTTELSCAGHSETKSWSLLWSLQYPNPISQAAEFHPQDTYARSQTGGLEPDTQSTGKQQEAVSVGHSQGI